MSDLARFRSDRVGAWSAEIWDGLIEAIGARFAPLEEQLGIQREVAESIIQRGLAVIEAELAPLVEQGGGVYDQIVDIKTDALAAYAIIQGMVDAGIPIAQVTGLQTALDAKATPGDITAAIDALKGGASAAFDTLAELAAALGDDDDFAATVTAALSNRLEKSQNLADLPDKAAARTNLGLGETAIFIKADPLAVAFTKTGAGTVSIKAGTIVEVDGSIYTFASATAVSMPSLTAGTDYAIWIEPDGDLIADTNFTSPATAASRKLGGFHYAPGGNATAFDSGGNTTPAINEFSLWDLKFRPSCPDPRGMTLVAGKFWCDIYLLGVNHHTDGSSKYNVTIADGSSPPKVPTMFGGNGSTAYSTLTWFEAAEVLMSHGKELLSYEEFAAAAYGTDEAAAGGTDPASTILRASFTSIWGLMLATGNMWVWGRNFGGTYGAASFVSQGRGGAYMLSNVAVLGSDWGGGSVAGSRASYWSYLPSDSGPGIGARGRADHLNHV